MKVKSFGCSFIYGSELSDDLNGSQPSKLSWPALVAKSLNAEYECFAKPGSGNLQIYNSLLNNIDDSDTVYIVGWSYIDRFDYKNLLKDTWQTILPNVETSKAHFYYANFHNQFKDKMLSLTLIHSALKFLTDKKFIMTWQDSLLWETDWHVDNTIINLQQACRPKFLDYDGLDFSNWSFKKGYPVSKMGHPLDQAHKAAAEHILKLSINKI